MVKDHFIVVGPEDENYDLAVKVLSNKSCKKILNLISEKEMSESDISKKLVMPLPTVHYNLERLKKLGLVDYDNYKYSEKGKEIRFYKSTEKSVVLSHGNNLNMKEILKKAALLLLIPVFIIGVMFLGEFFGDSSENFEMASLPTAGDEEENYKMVITDTDISENESIRSAVCGENDTNETNVSGCHDLDEIDTRVISE